jgi:hypothetical protein
VAAMLMVIAAYFLWQANKDGVFVSVVLAACAFFMSIRFQAKARLDEAKRNEEILHDSRTDG